MATTAPSCTPLMSWMPGSSTTASKIGESPVEGLKKMYLMPAALSCATNRAPPVPCISRAAPCATAPARRTRHRRQILRHRLGGDRAHPDRGQARYELAPGNPVVEILLDQFLHGILLQAHRRRKRAAHLATFWGPNQQSQLVGTGLLCGLSLSMTRSSMVRAGASLLF